MAKAKPDQAAVAFDTLHRLDEARAVRAAAIQYAAARAKYGATHRATMEAEARLYSLMFAMHPKAVAALGLVIGK